MAQKATAKKSVAEDPRYTQALQAYESGLRAMQEHKFDKAKPQFQKVIGGPAKELTDRANVYLRICQNVLERKDPQPRKPEDSFYFGVMKANEANYDAFPPAYREYLSRLRNGGLGCEYSSRYVGSLVADFHRTLIRGGVFIYPGTKKSPEGKLRLLYEANPLAFVAEQAGGTATDGRVRILDKQPRTMHERTPLIIGSTDEVKRVLSF